MRKIVLQPDIPSETPVLLTTKEKEVITRKFDNSSKYLTNFKNYTRTVTDVKELVAYLEQAESNGVLSIDTETNGLDAKRDGIVGISFHTFVGEDFTGTKSIYVPIHHYLLNGESNPLNMRVEDIKQALLSIDLSKIEVVMVNTVFDTRVILNNLGICINADFDCYIASRLLNENEPSHSLKTLFDKYVANDEVPKQSFKSLFDVKHFKYAPLDIATWYGGFDTVMTSGLYLYQKQFLGGKYTKRYSLEEVTKVFYELEMPVQKVIVKIEENGMELDKDFNAYLLVRKEEELADLEAQWYKEIEPFADSMRAYRTSYKNLKESGVDVKFKRLDDPVNLNSPHQLKVLYFDIIGEKSFDKALSTDEAHLKSFKHKSAQTLLDYRKRKKVISTYIGKFPEIAHEDGRIRSKFNSVGADTLRFTSSDINFQNIPSHDRDIRKVFRASEGNKLISADYSGQEVRITAQLAQDKRMMRAYKDGKDVYSEVASIIYGKPYEDCTNTKDGKFNADGAERRSVAKAIVLGIIYGKQPYSIAKELGKTSKEGQDIYDAVLNAFSGLRNLMETTLEIAKADGYVQTIVGTKRRLPEFRWDDFEVYGDHLSGTERSRILRALTSARGYMAIKNTIAKESRSGVRIVDNTGRKQQAERQALNARVQGSASFILKRALILIDEDKQLNSYNTRVVNIVHDEIIAECPSIYAKKASERIVELMKQASVDVGITDVAMEVDAVILDRWKGEEVEKGDYWLDYING